MSRGPDFIGLGAQRSGTSWIYACLYDHPQICAPTKEIHFFSHEANWRRGRAWYERHFRTCGPDTIAGEFSSTYLPAVSAADRIAALYPRAKLVVSLRHPVERLISNYLNDVTSGAISSDTPLPEAIRRRPEYIEQGRYATHLTRYLALFPPAQMLVLIYEDALTDPAAFIGRIYAFLGADAAYRPSMLSARVGIGRVPRSIALEKAVTRGTWALRGRLTRGLWWAAKRAGVGQALRRVNTVNVPRPVLAPQERARLSGVFADDISALECLLDRDLSAWRQ